MDNFSNQDNLSNPVSTGRATLLWLWEAAKVVIISLAIIIPVRIYIFQPFVVQGDSMEPNFENKQYLIIDEISQRFKAYQRGQVIVFHPPQNPKTYYIKRIIGLPGETVEFKEGKIIVYNQTNPNGLALSEAAYLASSNIDYFYQEKTTLKDGEYYVLGDNRNNSLDSRRIGPISADHIRGKVALRAFPFSKLTIFSSPTYNF